MKYIEVKTKNLGKDDCRECCFISNCSGPCRARRGFHWEKKI